MSWESIIGQNRVKALLKRAVQQERIAHAWLLHGPEGTGKDALAIEFAKVLNCTKGGPHACDACASCRRFETLQHPNVKLIVALPVGKSEKQGDDPVATLSADQISAIQEQMSLKARDPYHRISLAKANFIKINSVREVKRQSALTRSQEGRKVFIISRAEQMNDEAGNSLLKTLEEPLADTVLILTTSERARLLPTIVSRCQLVQCDPLQEQEIEDALRAREQAEPEQAKLAARMSGGSYTAARDLLSKDIVNERVEVVAFLRVILGNHKVALVSTVEAIVASHDKAGLERWLKLLQSWIREALVLSEGGVHVGLDEDRTALHNFVKNFPSANLVAAEGAIDAGIAHLNKNVYLPLVLLNLAFTLRSTLKQDA
ncbi:MAG: DNA polymerase III subunit delta' [Bacteroidota bacterium]